MTLNELLQNLKTTSPDHALVFATNEAKIRGGYHVTELKSSDVTSIDCGGNVTKFRETSLQLLDGGDHETHMPVGKFIGILAQSLKAIPSLGDAPAYVEFAPDNRGLSRFQMSLGAAQDGAFTILLGDDQAACKPAVQNACEPGCCAPAKPQSVCCG